MATLALINGKVWGRPGATAVAVEGDRISAVTSGRVTAHRVVDAGGASILPAFNDAHVHFLMGARSLGQLDLFGVKTQAEIERRIKDYAAAHDDPWVVGRGWLYSAFPGGMPSVALLDRLVPDRPTYLESFDAHTGWANSKALATVGVSTPDVLKESVMLGFVDAMPRPTKAQDLASLRAGMRLAAAMGIASVQEAGDGQNQLPLWDALRASGELTVRVRVAFDLEPGTDIRAYDRMRREGDEWITTGILKAFADGVVESKTAAMMHPYAGSEERGEPIWGDGDLRLAVREADARGWQVQVHAIGDAAIRQALDAFEGCDRTRRHRVEHIENPAPEDVPRFAALGVIASMQPQHSSPELIDVWRKNLGPERALRGWPWAGILASGGRLAFGTDWPVVPEDPFASLAEAEKTLSRDDAIAAWTSGAAYAEHAESFKGSLREGMLADIAVLDREMKKVEATAAGGRLVYEA